jgi:hypothetical protein
VVPLSPPPMLTMLCGFTLRHSLYHMYACLPLCYFLNINIFLSLFLFLQSCTKGEEPVRLERKCQQAKHQRCASITPYISTFT